MSRAAEVCRVHAEAIFCRAEMVYASDLRRLSLCGAHGNAGHSFGARLSALSIAAGGIGVVGVPLEEGFDSH